MYTGYAIHMFYTCEFSELYLFLLAEYSSRKCNKPGGIKPKILSVSIKKSLAKMILLYNHQLVHIKPNALAASSPSVQHGGLTDVNQHIKQRSIESLPKLCRHHDHWTSRFYLMTQSLIWMLSKIWETNQLTGWTGWKIPKTIITYEISRKTFLLLKIHVSIIVTF